jgi:hypothetical protein
VKAAARGLVSLVTNERTALTFFTKSSTVVLEGVLDGGGRPIEYGRSPDIARKKWSSEVC